MAAASPAETRTLNALTRVSHQNSEDASAARMLVEGGVVLVDDVVDNPRALGDGGHVRDEQRVVRLAEELLVEARRVHRGEPAAEGLDLAEELVVTRNRARLHGL
eukprot:CAMPEP_0206168554 /NCGR_PEP_ID=MMETSP1474-20131121/32517_1 /ASSEMBLY_ACC=CAM_ASM_001110 /TAXON_ID=97495 /ORGANISM="Imantonia sp., Strain RCC918" /LENGTH=104 /DNA_ID=CAMNT_0053573999 /DNA_START=55 /DNA_END=365 /DNA_ORIENTATION=+